MMFDAHRLRREIAELKDRVEGLETLLADLMQDGRIIVQLPPAAHVGEDMRRPSPGWERL